MVLDLEKTVENFTCPSPDRIYDGLCCPITRHIFNRPVNFNGNTYEMSALLRWFKKTGSQRDPLTGKELSDKMYVDYTTTYMRDLFLEKNPDVKKYELSQEDKDLIEEYDNRVISNKNNSITPNIIFQFVLSGSVSEQISLPVN